MTWIFIVSALFSHAWATHPAQQAQAANDNTYQCSLFASQISLEEAKRLLRTAKFDPSALPVSDLFASDRMSLALWAANNEPWATAQFFQNYQLKKSEDSLKVLRAIGTVDPISVLAHFENFNLPEQEVYALTHWLVYQDSGAVAQYMDRIPLDDPALRFNIFKQIARHNGYYASRYAANFKLPDVEQRFEGARLAAQSDRQGVAFNLAGFQLLTDSRVLDLLEASSSKRPLSTPDFAGFLNLLPLSDRRKHPITLYRLVEAEGQGLWTQSFPSLPYPSWILTPPHPDYRVYSGLLLSLLVARGVPSLDLNLANVRDSQDLIVRLLGLSPRAGKLLRANDDMAQTRFMEQALNLIFAVGFRPFDNSDISPGLLSPYQLPKFMLYLIATVKKQAAPNQPASKRIEFFSRREQCPLSVHSLPEQLRAFWYHPKNEDLTY